MKKALMVLGLAACTTMVFAQTHKLSQSQAIARPVMKANVEQPKQADFKGSIFTKNVDTLQVWHFGPNQRDSLVYGASGLMTTAELANYPDIDSVFNFPHGAMTEAWTRWNLIDHVGELFNASSDVYGPMGYGSCFMTNGRLNIYPSYIAEYFSVHSVWLMDSAYNFNFPEDSASHHGFMLMSRAGANGNTPRTHAYFQFPKFEIPENATSIDISMQQYYVNYYDYCFVDYLDTNNNWHSVSFNVIGIDAAVNTGQWNRVNVTLPASVCGYDSTAIRIRYFSNRPGGYFWCIDNLAVEVRSGADASRWKELTNGYVEGYYGLMPQGLNLPLSWYTQVNNNGGYARTDVKVQAYHLDANRENPSIVQEATFDNIQPDSTAYLTLDNHLLFSNQYVPGYYGFPGNGADSIFEDGVIKYLPTTTPGKQFVTTLTTSKSEGYEKIDSIQGDTMIYTVSDLVTYTVNGVVYSGYRWGRDNGILANNSAFTFGYSDEQVPNTDPVRYYVSDTGHYNRNGYTVYTSFFSGDNPPAPGEWAFLGLELVAATTYDDPGVIDGDMITPAFLWDPRDTAGYLYYVQTGSDNYSIDADNDVSYLSNSYYLLEDDPDFKHIFIPFPNQPSIDTAASYLVGYKKTSNGNFATAAARSSVRTPNGYYYFSRDSTGARDYANRRSPNRLDVYVEDGSFISAGDNVDYFPMIRLIVGPRVEIPYDTVMIEGRVSCADAGMYGDAGEATFNIGTDRYNSGRIVYFLCDSIYHAVPKGNSPTYYITAEDGYMVTEVYIDGELRIPFDEANPSGDQDANLTPNKTIWYEHIGENDSIQRTRTDFIYTFDNISTNHTIRIVTAEWAETEGIDAAAENVKMNLRPNPATGMVRLSLEGVNGTVDCNIIDMSGRVVYTSKLNAETENTINLSKLAAGAYFVRVTNSNMSKVEKLIVR